MDAPINSEESARSKSRSRSKSPRKFTEVMDTNIDNSKNLVIETHIPEISQLYLFEDVLYVIGFQDNDLVCAQINAQ